ncbi:MAG: polysaccharide deacetylase family protein [Clostridia bacterium]|nr:polysaccharide deacetylase family protein [Clostridia bacterium]
MIHALLTVDDISSRNTPAMVDYLKEKGIKAIFFATGRNVEQFYQEALYAVKNGMIIGNHSYSHPYFSKISLDACIDEIERCEQILDKLYQDSDVERVYRPFRFPYGDKGGKNRDDLQRYFKEKGFHKVDDTRIPYPWWHEHGLNRDIDTFWTFDFEEYKIRPASGFTLESVWKKIYDEHPQKGAALLAQESRHILLLHAHDETEQMLPAYYRLFIDEFLNHGMVFDEPAFL